MSPSMRFNVLRRDAFTCRYCGRKPPLVILEVDHVVPRSRGGGDDDANLVTACWQCNRGKRDAQGVLPPPQVGVAPRYPVGLFFLLRHFALGWDAPHTSPDAAYQGYVMAVDGDDIWVGTFDWDTGSEGPIACLPRNEWRGWTFYPTSRTLRRAYLDMEVRMGISDQRDVEAFEATPE